MNEKLKKLTKKAKKVGVEAADAVRYFAPLGATIVVTVVAFKAMNEAYMNSQRFKNYDNAWRRGFNEGGNAVIEIIKRMDNGETK